jgi:hypothetical protein
MDELADSRPLRRDPDALRRRLADDGYLFFRGLLPAAEISAAAAAVLAELCRGGWVDHYGIPSADRRALNSVEALGDPAVRAAITSPAFNRIPYLAQLRGLAIQPGSHLGPPQRPRAFGQGERGWATTHYRAGDALVFHCLTSHAALPNRGTSLRISGDFRWQRPDQPAPAQLVLAPAGRHRELFSRVLAREPWWEPVPGGITLSPRERLAAAAPGPSRYFTVHPGWRHWHPPGGVVHAARRA